MENKIKSSSQAKTTARPNAPRRALLMVTPLPMIAPELLVGVLPVLLPVGEPEPVWEAVELPEDENEAGLTAVVGETLTVAVPTSTVKYEPARGVPRPAALMYEAKLGRVDNFFC